jgi:hypothetical protein
MTGGDRIKRRPKVDPEQSKVFLDPEPGVEETGLLERRQGARDRPGEAARRQRFEAVTHELG